MIDSYKDLQDVLCVAGYTQNGLQAIALALIVEKCQILPNYSKEEC
jgi:hypothetical protein